ncbi:hypothetical protein AK812_SmicGene23581 [Symbiodinium microadriaticum]|uniref:Uncharacterized protein n=1 Tax=Symbiodinium microadriaticum TaxID=2951 RepID=A0A1Q9DGY7_SYMMI|nr:hypothetical protein AK812_SmicGene23581 [Symbiodinium microadriaticum]
MLSDPSGLWYIVEEETMIRDKGACLSKSACGCRRLELHRSSRLFRRATFGIFVAAFVDTAAAVGAAAQDHALSTGRWADYLTWLG